MSIVAIATDAFLGKVEYASKELQQSRLDTCKACPDFTPKVSVCKKCGCYCPAKVKFQISECPAKRW